MRITLTYIAITVLAIFVCCVTYTHINSLTPKGAELKIDYGYDESSEFYDVSAIYVENADVAVSVTPDELGEEYEVIIFNLVKGRKTLLLLNGIYDHVSGTLAHTSENFNLFIALDTFNISDTVYLESNRIRTIFYHNRIHNYLHHTKYTTKLDGYIIINSVKENMLSGVISFSGKTDESWFSSRTYRISDDHIDSSVNAHIQFRATKRQIIKKSTIIGYVLMQYREKRIEE